MAVKTIKNDSDFNKHIKANKFVLATFMEEDTMLEVCSLQSAVAAVVETFLITYLPGQLARYYEGSEEGELHQGGSIPDPGGLCRVRHRGPRTTNIRISRGETTNYILLHWESAIIIAHNVPPGHDRDGQAGHGVILSTTKWRRSHHGETSQSNTYCV